MGEVNANGFSDAGSIPATSIVGFHEICDDMWADIPKIKRMVDDGIFVLPSEWYPYMDELFYFCKTTSF